MMFRTHMRAFAFAPLLAAVALITACDDDPVEPHEDEPEAIRLIIGEDTVEIDGGQTGSVTIPLGGTAIAAVFLDADGDEVDVHDDEFELRIEPDDEQVVTFTRSDAFSGTLNGESEGTSTAEVLLWHLPVDHDDFEADLIVTVE